MEDEKVCENLVEACKHEAKQLVEFTATRRKVHWTHPSFISFCVSVEEILSYGVKRKYHSYYRSKVTPSGRVLQDLGKVLPEAASIYEKCFDENSKEKEDYTPIHIVGATERKIVWIRAALIEGKLNTIVEGLLNNAQQYYTKQSVLCHPVYGEIFKYLIDGPCSIRYSRLKSSDTAVGVPSPAEIVERHNQVLSLSTIKGKQDDGRGESIATEAAWDHVRSLYQSTSSTCLFGKNNIMVQPAGFSQPLQGYLTLLRDGNTLLLKWIPNSLLQDSTNAHSSLWKTIMSIDIVMRIAHIHCHRTPGQSAELILIGYDGIAPPPLIFPHQPSFFLFLECLENSLLPQGCLEPPLWYIKDQTSKAKISAAKKNHHHTKKQQDEGEWFEAMDVWNQVFRIRYGPRPQDEDAVTDECEKIHAKLPPQPQQSLDLNLSSYSGGGFDESSESDQSDSEGSESMVTVEKPGSLARGDWEKFQSKVSRQLLARYFYSWLSYCRHMSKVRANVAHLVGPTTLCPESHTQVVTKEDWEEFEQSQNKEDRWKELLKKVYFKGSHHEMRKKVWPYLLGLYPVSSTPQEREAILEHATRQYHKVLGEWQQVELTKKEIELEAWNGHRVGSLYSGEVSPTLSVISSSPLRSSDYDESRDKSHDDGDPVPNGSSCDETRDQPCARLDDNVGEPNGINSHPSSHDQALLSHDEEDQSHDQACESHDQASESSSANQTPSKRSNRTRESESPLPPGPVDLVMSSQKLSSQGKIFAKELFNIDKDIPRCDRDFWYFQNKSNLQKVRNIVCSFVWTHLSDGYSQGMCDLLCPILVVMESEPLAYACYLKLMESAIKLFPPNTGMNTRLANVQTLLQVMEPDYYQYLSERPMGDGLFYAYRWLLVTFKREFSYDDIFRLWETVWASRMSEATTNFEEFFALAIMIQFKTAIMDAHLDPSDILNLFTDLAEKRAIDGNTTIRIAQQIIHTLQVDLTKKDC